MEGRQIKDQQGVPFFRGLSFMLMGALATLGTQKIMSDPEPAVTVDIPAATEQAFANNDGNVAALYETFAKAVDPMITAGGQNAEVLVIANGDTAHFQHQPQPPKSPIVIK